MKQFMLSAILEGHTNDVRCVASFGLDGLVSGSRDKKAKLWRKVDNRDWQEFATFEGHTKYLSAVVIMPPDNEHIEGLVYTGSNDGKIRAFVPSNPEPDHVLEGHASTISSLFLSRTKTLLSGSWDCTAKVWLNKRVVMTLEGHEGAVWCGIILSETGLMVTGAADGKLKIWKAGQCKSTVSSESGGHSQAVRDLTIVSARQFLSCGNDGLIRHWQIDPDTFSVSALFSYTDPDFVYSLTVSPDSQLWAASGENSGIKIFYEGKINQVVAIPAISVWSVCFLDNGDIAAGCSDNRVYVFTVDASRQASDDMIALYNSELEKVSQPMDTTEELPEEVGGVKVKDMPGPDALLLNGKRNGQTMMVRDGNTVTVHSWSSSDEKWTKVGNVVGQPKSTDKVDKSGRGLGGGRVMYEGVEYDHVFHIDVDEGVVLKLPYNNGQDPYTVAQDFIHKHGLPQDYLEQIANFIVQNASKPVTFEMGSACDPLTGGNAYVSGSGGVRASSFTKKGGGAADPFTGDQAYTSTNGSSSSSASESCPAFFPQTEFVTFSQMPKVEALTSKLLEFNGKVPASVQLPEEHLMRLPQKFGQKDSPVEAADVSNLFRVLRWPREFAFPGLDLVRLSLLSLEASEAVLASSKNHSSGELVDLLLQAMTDVARPTNQMLAMRSLANLFGSPQGCSIMNGLQETVLQHLSALFPVNHKNIEVAMATVLVNYAVASKTEATVSCVNLSVLFFDGLSDPEAKFRSLVALGTLLASGHPGYLEAARGLDAKEKLRTAKMIEDTSKVAQCAQSILDKFQL